VIEPPEAIRQLAAERAAARVARDFALADALRDQMAEAGWVVVDGPAGFTFERVMPVAPVTVCLIVDGWLDDARQCVSSVLRWVPEDWVVLVANCTDVDLESVFADFGPRVFVVGIGADCGWSDAVVMLVSDARSPNVVLMDMSTEVVGEGALEALVSALDAPDVVAAAWQGVDVDLADEWRSMVPAGPGEVDAFLGYCVALDRSAAVATPPHPKARFYRNADLEWSLRLRAAGGRIVVPAGELPLRQGRHHGYHDSDPEVRERESRRTYNRILADFRGRTEILRPRP
jgi:GT2 family glycosyltransferase